MVPALDAVLPALPAANRGGGSALTRALRNVAASFGVAVMGSVLNSSYRASLEAHLVGLPADDYHQRFTSMFESRPADEPLGLAIRETMNGVLGQAMERDGDVLLARAELVLNVSALRARLWKDLVQAQEQFAALIAARSGRPADDFEVRVTAMVVVSALTVASTEWVRVGSRADLMEMINRALEVVETGAQVHLSPGGVG